MHKLNPRDRYGVASDFSDFFREVFGDDPGIDPFFDPHQRQPCYVGGTIHEDCTNDRPLSCRAVIRSDAFEGDDWWQVIAKAESVERELGMVPRTFYANPRFSSGGPPKLGARLRRQAALLDGIAVVPSNPGAAWWVRDVWPRVTAVAWMGRYDFEALCDMPAEGKRAAVPKGHRSEGGSFQEIAALLFGAAHYERFKVAAQSMGWGVCLPA